jgi:hypothetical protein
VFAIGPRACPGQRLLAHSGAVAVKAAGGGGDVAVHVPAKPHGAHGLVGAAAGGAGHAGDGHADLGARMGDGAFGHGAGHGLAHGAVLAISPAGHAQHLGLGLVGIGDEAALEPLAGACQVGAGGGDHAAGAAFGGGQHPATGQQGGGNLNQIGLQRLIGQALAAHFLIVIGGVVRGHQKNLHSAITSRVQKAATKSSHRMPQPPRQPKPLNRLSAQPTGPGLAASKKRNRAKATIWPQKAHGHGQPQHQPEGHDLVPHDGAGVGHAHVAARWWCRPTSPPARRLQSAGPFARH